MNDDDRKYPIMKALDKHYNHCNSFHIMIEIRQIHTIEIQEKEVYLGIVSSSPSNRLKSINSISEQ